jgi:hypothetical protein
MSSSEEKKSVESENKKVEESASSATNSKGAEPKGTEKGAEVKKDKKKKKQSRNKDTKEALAAAPPESKKVLLAKKDTADRDERKEQEAHLARLLKNLAALQERMYSIRYDDETEVEDKFLQLKNFAAQILYAERQISLALRESVEVFEDQLDLHELGLEGILDHVHASEVSEANAVRTGSFMRTPSTQSVQGQEPRKKWQSLFKMYKEKKDQTAVAKGQYVSSRDSNLQDIDEEIMELRKAVTTLRGRKNLSPKDERALETMQEQLKVRVQQKERLARAIITGQQ